MPYSTEENLNERTGALVVQKKVKFMNQNKKLADSSSQSTDDENDDDSKRNDLINVNSKTRTRKSKKPSAVWEVIEGYRDVNMKVIKPESFEGILLKRRNWPMKGWHKRYFILSDGILSYGKSKADISRNKTHGSVNVYLSIVSYIKSARRILIDASTSSVCHLKAKSQIEFESWLEHIKQHRLYHQYKYSQPTIASNNSNKINTINVNLNDDTNNKLNMQDFNMDANDISKIAVKNIRNEDIDYNFQYAQENLDNLGKILNSLNAMNMQTSSKLFSYVKRFSPEAKAKSSDYLTVNAKIHVSKSNPNLNVDLLTQNALNSSNQNLNNSQLIANDDNKLKINFYQGAKTIYDQLFFIYQQLENQKEKLIKSSIENSPLQAQHRSQSIMSTISLQDSQLQFYDAIECFTSDSESDEESEENSENDGTTTDNNNTNASNTSKKQRSKAIVVPEELLAQKILQRRRALPACSPDTTQISMWGILRKAIGKDLSKISLPVVLNEPLSILQRLCEELEYSDLLDAANLIQDPYDRMVYVAAFIISGYASSYYRNGSKNFNPLLGETYELIRPDKGWKYHAEQVSHHPPISATNCHSKSFIHEQVFHAKIKFWGRSMEVHPEGYTRVTLPKFNETYQWNKVIMYVYNVMSPPRRIEHCGEITVRCTNGVSCTITFPKSVMNAGQKNEFYGDIIYDNVVKRKIFGQWHETFLCGTDNTAKTIWRMGAMPEDSSLYYGFTRFAIELNEITEDIKDLLPCTDSRFRGDQRLLEEGYVDKSETEKQRIEEVQRTRRRVMESKNEIHQPLWFQRNEENDWQANQDYWIKRENPTFKNMKDQIKKLW